MKLRLFYALATFATIIFVYQDVSAQNTSPYWSLSGNNNASSTTTKLGTTNGIDLRFFTNNVERLRILSSNGNVGIGSLTPTERLRIDGPSGINPVRIQVNGATKFRIDKNGGVAIGLSVMPPPNGLFVAGNVGPGKEDVAGRIQPY